MNRQEFISQLAQLLKDIPEAERQEALDYYNSYFDDAGPENEASVIQELGGDPQKAAASLKAEFQSAQTGRQNYGEFTEQGYRDNRIPHDGQMPQPFPRKEKQSQDHQGFHREFFKNNKTTKIILTILILAVTSTLWLGLLGTIAGLVFGLLGAVLSLFVGFAATVFGLLASGIALAVSGLIKCLTSPALGLLALGLGLLILAVGILLLLLFLWLAANPLPKFIRWCGGCISGFFRWCKRKWKSFID